MDGFLLRDAHADDFAAIVALNEAAVQHTSPLSLRQLRELAALSHYRKVVAQGGRTVAFLLAMRESAPYANDNFAWFAARYPRFVYVDRIVVDAGFAGLKLGQMLYDDLFAFARSSGTGVVTCEYNLQPPNPASQRFHDRFGFTEVGRRWAVPGTKLVSLQAAVA